MKPLTGIRVLDLSRYIAGPYCGMLLAQLGAEVIKVEPPGIGDECRNWAPVKNGFSGYFASNNRGKKSFCLNLKNLESRKILAELVAKSDVFLHNYTDKVCQKLDMQYEAISATNKQIIYCGISGFGSAGPYKDRKGFDTIFQAMGGVTWLTGEKEGAPIKAGVPVADVSTGIFGALSVLAALYNRQQTGVGEKIDLALLDSLLNFLPVALAFYSLTGKSPARMGSEHPGRVPSAVFKCAEEKFVHLSVTDQQWQELVKILAVPELADSFYKTGANRVKKRERIMLLLQKVLAKLPREEFVTKCMQAGIPCGEVLAVEDIIANEQVKFRQSLASFTVEQTGEFFYANYPAKFLQIDTSLSEKPPVLGKHTKEVLRSVLGYEEAHIISLEQKGVI